MVFTLNRHRTKEYLVHLLGSGTQSGPGEDQGGSLLELTRGGKQALAVGGETRTFLQDGDAVILRAHCERPDARRIGFGDCAGTVLPAALRHEP